jgi:hypothetical protein
MLLPDDAHAAMPLYQSGLYEPPRSLVGKQPKGSNKNVPYDDLLSGFVALKNSTVYSKRRLKFVSNF